MPERQTQQEDVYVRTVTRVGKRSLSVVIPPEILNALEVEDRQKLAIMQEGNRIVIEKWNGDADSS
jgi:antitoxin component of MazEF toxin-antitoxin module